MHLCSCAHDSYLYKNISYYNFRTIQLPLNFSEVGLQHCCRVMIVTAATLLAQNNPELKHA
jgi:hypothetical protein